MQKPEPVTAPECRRETIEEAFDKHLSQLPSDWREGRPDSGDYASHGSYVKALEAYYNRLLRDLLTGKAIDGREYVDLRNRALRCAP